MTEKVVMLAEDTETVINYCKHNIGDWAEVYTTDKNVMKRFENFCFKHPELGKLIKEDKFSMTFSMHPKCASLYPRAPRSANWTDEQKQAMAERLRESAKKK